MFVLPFSRIAEGCPAGQATQLVGPEVMGSVVPSGSTADFSNGAMVHSAAMELFLVRGPTEVSVAPRFPGWSLVVPLTEQASALRHPAIDADRLQLGEMLLLAPGARADLTLPAESTVEVIVTPPLGPAALAPVGPEPARGLAWLVRPAEVEPALGPRDSAKIAVGNLWRPQSPPGLWQGGTEILCEKMALGVFRTGAPETAHQHERTWEIYQVLEGSLNLMVRDYRLGPWQEVVVRPQEALVLPPGTAHMVRESSRHLSAVIQAPPAISDREIVSVTAVDPSRVLAYDD
jgi:mannose-6-phosphate isomerase-like protein (cupin superfamily)